MSINVCLLLLMNYQGRQITRARNNQENAQNGPETAQNDPETDKTDKLLVKTDQNDDQEITDGDKS